MKRKAILAVVIMMIMPGANAAGIRSANGQSQSAWEATAEYQSFQCPEGTSRGGGVDMNFTTDRSDDYYFVECNPIVVYVPTPTPISTQPAPSVPVVDTQTATTSTTTTITQTATTVSTPVVDTNTVTVVKSSTITVDYLTLDWAKVDMNTFDWNDFWVWLTAYIDELLAVLNK